MVTDQFQEHNQLALLFTLMKLADANITQMQVFADRYNFFHFQKL